MSAFMITPIGIAIIALYSFVIGAAALFLGRLLKGFRWRWWLLAPPALILMALPWAEEAWIAWHFNEACKDAGVKVYRTVEVEGYVDDTSRQSRRSVKPTYWKADSKSLAPFDRAGYSIIEHMLDDGGVYRDERRPDGLMGSVLDHPTMRYHLVHHYQPTRYRYEEPIGWRLQKMERQVIDSQTGEILGRDTIIKRWYPMADAVWIGLFGSYPKLCPGPQSPLNTKQPPFPQSVLKPVSHS